MNKNRHRYRVIIALDNEVDVDYFAHKIAEKFNARYGGATILRAIGYWAEDGDQDLVVYGKPMIEPARVIEVVTVEECMEGIKALVQIAASQASQNGVTTVHQWIHLEHEEIECNHFQI